MLRDDQCVYSSAYESEGTDSPSDAHSLSYMVASLKGNDPPLKGSMSLGTQVNIHHKRDLEVSSDPPTIYGSSHRDKKFKRESRVKELEGEGISSGEPMSTSTMDSPGEFLPEMYEDRNDHQHLVKEYNRKKRDSEQDWEEFLDFDEELAVMEHFNHLGEELKEETVENLQRENMAHAEDLLNRMEAAAAATHGSGGRNRTKKNVGGQKMEIIEAFHWSRWDRKDDLSWWEIYDEIPSNLAEIMWARVDEPISSNILLISRFVPSYMKRGWTLPWFFVRPLSIGIKSQNDLPIVMKIKDIGLDAVKTDESTMDYSIKEFNNRVQRIVSKISHMDEEQTFDYLMRIGRDMPLFQEQFERELRNVGPVDEQDGEPQGLSQSPDAHMVVGR